MTTLAIIASVLMTVFPDRGEHLEPITTRVSIQTDTARTGQIICGEWVAVGSAKSYSICLDSIREFGGRPSFRFELREGDNTLKGYGKGTTKGRAELSYCYATSSDFDGVTQSDYRNMQDAKSVYHHGKGSVPQGSTCRYRFSVMVPATLDPESNFIFAQWHGMPDRYLVSDPDGRTRLLDEGEFAKLMESNIFRNDTGYEKIQATYKDGTAKTDKDGNPIFRPGSQNGWKVEQGGYPPLAFSFSDGYFCIKANSDRKMMTDNSDRLNTSPAKHGVGVTRRSEYKTSVIAYRLPADEFPKDIWVTFDISLKWTGFGYLEEKVISPGLLDVTMSYGGTSMHIIDNMQVLMGRNDLEGYYFKFGIYRTGSSEIPVICNLAGFSQEIIRE